MNEWTNERQSWMTKPIPTRAEHDKFAPDNYMRMDRRANHAEWPETNVEVWLNYSPVYTMNGSIDQWDPLKHKPALNVTELLALDYSLQSNQFIWI